MEFEPRLRPAFEYLLGNVLICETMDHAIALRRRNRINCRLVTLDGEQINAGGAMSGGRGGAQESGGVVSRKQEIARTADELALIQERRRTLLEARDAAKKSAYEHGLAEVATEIGRLGEEINRLDSERGQLLTSEIGCGRRIDELTARMQERAIQRDRQQELVNQARVDAATGAERLEAIRNHVAHLVRSLQAIEDSRDERRHRLHTLDARRAQLALEVTAQRAEAEHAQAELDASADELTALSNERDRQRDRIEEGRQEARVLAARTSVANRELAEAQRKAGEASLRIATLAERLLEEQGLDITEAFTHWVTPDDFEIEAKTKELAAFDAERRNLGPVNMAALDELEEAQEREAFLGNNHADLVNARDRLLEVIADLDQTSSKLFHDTYLSVRDNFQALFRKLFGGGKADLLLETKDEQGNAVDPLEAGLEIMACPPGKNPKIITQLSGGEKALTAIALLFAVYLTKPSPFCILDEVDAPLDEANVDVYNSMIREFTVPRGDKPGSQFIVITHKKRSMQRADAIYGITQNEPGVSTKISVRFDDVDKALGGAGGDGELKATTRGAGPFTG